MEFEKKLSEIPMYFMVVKFIKVIWLVTVYVFVLYKGLSIVPDTALLTRIIVFMFRRTEPKYLCTLFVV